MQSVVRIVGRAQTRLKEIFILVPGSLGGIREGMTA